MTGLVTAAKRIIAQGRACKVPADVYRVTGDSGDLYYVIVPRRDSDGATCSCPATGVCSHVLAGRGSQYLDEQQAVAA